MNKREVLKFDLQYSKFLETLQLQGYSKSTIEAYTHAIRRVCLYFDRCPDHRLTKDELKPILQTCSKHIHDQPSSAIVIACNAISNTLRIGEGLNLQVGDIDHAHKRVHIRLGKGKTKTPIICRVCCVGECEITHVYPEKIPINFRFMRQVKTE